LRHSWKSAEPRISAAFFVYPDATTVVRSFDTCQGPDNPARYEDVTMADYVRALREDAQRTGRPSVRRRRYGKTPAGDVAATIIAGTTVSDDTTASRRLP
jgi:hypothetical protein